MDTNALHSRRLKVGQVFTPMPWAEWLVTRWGILDSWISGATICEPTAGQGGFVLALFKLARSKGIQITPELLSRLTLIEIHRPHIEVFKLKAKQEFDVEFPSSQLFDVDIITNPPDVKFDILFGNPPWSNFTDLPDSYKEILKPHFVSEGLVPDKKAALLGSSRADIAALVLKVVLGRTLKKGGVGCFYIPLSLFFGDGAHRGFRNFTAGNRYFSVDEVYEFTTTKVFEKVNTSYCCAKFTVDKPTEFPIVYFKEIDGNWVECRAQPFETQSDPWRVLERDSAQCGDVAVKIELSSRQKPRQGVNTCGANSIFIFEEKPTYLPEKFVFPLVTKEIWRMPDTDPHRWILLPYNVRTGRPLSWSDIEAHDELKQYLTSHRDKLERRKGKLIQSVICRGIWWSLLGVGPYSFAPYKVIWEAYGRRHFRPIIRSCREGQSWQANQAMHAFVPCWIESDAIRIQSALLHPRIQELLRQLNGEGKCNWAQPGKIKRIISFEHSKSRQPVLPSLLTSEEDGKISGGS